MSPTKPPRLPAPKRQELIGALLDRFLPRALPERKRPEHGA